jgi:hypothetical protein
MTSPLLRGLRVVPSGITAGSNAGPGDRDVTAREHAGVVNGRLPLDQVSGVDVVIFHELNQGVQHSVFDRLGVQLSVQ